VPTRVLPPPSRFEERIRDLEVDLRLLLLGRARAGWARASSQACAAYEAPMRRAGFTEAQIGAVAARSIRWCWSPLELAVLALADAVVLDDGCIPDAVADELNAHFSDDEVLALALAISSTG
jgi:hypothetical protein